MPERELRDDRGIRVLRLAQDACRKQPGWLLLCHADQDELASSVTSKLLGAWERRGVDRFSLDHQNGYAYRIAENALNDYYRKRQRAWPIANDWAEPWVEDSTREVDDRIVARKACGILDRWVEEGKVQARHRDAWISYLVEGTTQADLAARYRVHPGTIPRWFAELTDRLAREMTAPLTNGGAREMGERHRMDGMTSLMLWIAAAIAVLAQVLLHSTFDEPTPDSSENPDGGVTNPEATYLGSDGDGWFSTFVMGVAEHLNRGASPPALPADPIRRNRARSVEALLNACHLHPEELVDAPTSFTIPSDELLVRVQRAHERHWQEFALDGVATELGDVIVAAEKLGLAVPRTEALICLADIRRHRGDWAGSEQAARDAITLATDLRDPDRLVRAHLEVASTLFRQGKEPIDDLEKAQEFLSNATSSTAALVMYVRAKIAHGRGDLLGARTLLEEALALSEQEGQDEHLQCRIRIRLGFVERLGGRLSRAEMHLDAGLEIAKAFGFQRLHAYCLLDLGMVILKTGDDAKAGEYFRDALRLFSPLGDVLGAAHVQSALGAEQRLEGQFDQAEVLQRGALVVYVHSGRIAGEALARRRLGQVLRDHREYEEAQEQLDAAIGLYRELNSLDGEAVSLAALAKLIRSRFDSTRALPYALRAIDRLGEMAGQFRQGTERAQFSRLHRWCYSLAFLCAAESNDAEAVLKVASVVQADKDGQRIREALLGSKNARLRDLARQITDCELSLHGSGDEAVGHAADASQLRSRLDALYDQLRDADADVAEALRRGSVEATPLPAGYGQHRLSIWSYEVVVPPRLHQGVISVWEGSSVARTVAKAALSPEEWQRFDLLSPESATPDDAGRDLTETDMHRFSDLLLPIDLMNALVCKEVRNLQLAGERRNFPLGACLLDGRRVDSFTVVEPLLETVYPYGAD